MLGVLEEGLDLFGGEEAFLDAQAYNFVGDFVDVVVEEVLQLIWFA